MQADRHTNRQTDRQTDIIIAIFRQHAVIVQNGRPENDSLLVNCYILLLKIFHLRFEFRKIASGKCSRPRDAVVSES